MHLQNLTVGDLMTTATITAKVKDTIQHADLEMRFAGIRHLPVVDDNHHVLGIISNRDLFLAFGKTSEKKLPVAMIMTSDVRVVRAETPAHEAAALMLKYKIGALPVIGDGEQLVGIITESDFLEIAYRALGGKVDPDLVDEPLLH